MLTVYMQGPTGVNSAIISQKNQQLILNAVWIDLLSPSSWEEKIVERYLNLEIPTKKEMKEIEPSSRLYSENNALFMTVMMVAQSNEPEPTTDAVTFILINDKLVSLRYVEPQAFNVFIAKLGRLQPKESTSISLLVGLLEITTDRIADILEKVSYTFDDISRLIFQKNNINRRVSEVSYKHLLQAIGANRVLGTKTHDSLISFIRLVSFFEQNLASNLSHAMRLRLNVISNDLRALGDHAIFISAEVNFLLDATLGMINIEQNDIIKIFSVAAVIFLPPTLIASVYGMNFNHMPELHWQVGYPMALGLMIISAILPYRYFKKKKWF